ncbi:GNAT family N-acetyltransferase [Halorubrum tebenquichense]|uniref:GCN5-related N-acetyltransferase n=1 Tax=Halorubrum tebenquichense DSM 14210 TaxID=1227485 RepID=M0DSH3_9EURY|nr:GNAT family N-acetyltransferase [Halorubrum tebenquichense]ELZ37054.1 GCN5-related N-acetyltransferase [Halorubrum tebenquichense DSM 14210]
MTIDPATADDRLDVLRILDAAMLETDADAVADRTAAGDALVARSERTGGVVGALVATRPDSGRLHVDAVAVRRARRGRGIGSALVAAAVERGERDDAVETVTAAFDPELRAFYAALGFAVRPADGSGGTEAAPVAARDSADGDGDRLFGRVSTAGPGSP